MFFMLFQGITGDPNKVINVVAGFDALNGSRNCNTGHQQDVWNRLVLKHVSDTKHKSGILSDLVLFSVF